MGLAPYGSPKFKSLILEKLIDLKDDGSFKLNMDYFNYATGLTMTNKNFLIFLANQLEIQKKINLLNFIWILLHPYKPLQKK